jgi:hypothetical protein
MIGQTVQATLFGDPHALSARAAITGVATSFAPILILVMMTGVPMLFAVIAAKHAGFLAVAAAVGSFLRRIIT